MTITRRTHSLTRHQFVRVDDPAGVTVRCRSGRLWITVDGELDDIVLDAGASHGFRSGTLALVGVLDAHAEATIHRHVPDRAHGWHPMTWLRALARLGGARLPAGAALRGR